MSGCPTALKTIKIIEVISKHPEGLILSEIAAKLGYPVSTVFDILHTLVLEDIVVIKDGRLKNYAIGPKLYIYGDISQCSSLVESKPAASKASLSGVRKLCASLKQKNFII